MDAVEVGKELKRMCLSYGDQCIGCGIFDAGGCCGAWIALNPEKTIAIVEKWSKEHPTKTNRERFKEVFGFDVEARHLIPEQFVWEWLNKPYEEPKEDNE